MVAMAPMGNFLWGPGGRAMTPEDVARERKIAEALISAGADMSPIGHPLQGFARIAQALSGKIREGRADRAETEGRSGASSALAGLFGGGAQAGGVATGGTVPPASPGGTSQPSTGGNSKYSDAIAGIESGGNYQAIGPTHPKLGRALGKHQMMEANIPAWSRQALGREISADEFLASPDAQEAIFEHVFGGYVDRFGPEGAAQAWFAGPGGVGKTGRKDVLGTDVGSYGRRFMDTLGPQSNLMVPLPGGEPQLGTQVASLDPSAGIAAALAEQGIDPNGPQAQAFASLHPGGGGAPAVQPIQPEVIQPLQPETVQGTTIAGPEMDASSPIIRALLGLRGPDTASRGGAYPAPPPMPAASVGAPVAPDMPMGGGTIAGAQYPPAPPAPPAFGMPMGGGVGQGAFPPMGGGGPSQAAIAAVLGNPWASDGEKAVATALLQQQMKAGDPMAQLQLQKAQLELEQARNPKPEYDIISGRDGSIFRVDKNTGQMEQVYGGKPDQPTDVQEYEYAKGQGYAGTFQEFQVEQKRAGASQVNIDQKAEGAFDKKLAEKQAETFDAMSTEGMNAKADIAIIGELDRLLAGQGGIGTGVQGWLAQKGIDVGGATSDLQAVQALINKLVPTQRQPGSGTMSDRDVELFTRSLPNLWNQPGGNQIILNTMQGLAQYKQAQGEIADMVLTGEISRQEARRMLRELPNPLAGFGAPKAKQPAPKQQPAIIDGYTIEEVE